MLAVQFNSQGEVPSLQSRPDLPLSFARPKYETAQTRHLFCDELDQIVERENAFEPALVIHDWQTPHAEVAHLVESSQEVVIFPGRNRMPAHHLVYQQTLGVLSALCQHTNDQVAIGQEANGHPLTVLLVDDNQRAHVMFAYTLGRFDERIVSMDRDDLTSAEFTGSHSSLPDAHQDVQQVERQRIDQRFP